jgi:DNA-binding GntR family transcriptional regulator
MAPVRGEEELMPEETYRLTPVSEALRGVRLASDRPMVAQVYEILRARIVGVDFLPGQRLSEKEISSALEASKTPVREALIKLEDVGLVDIIPRSGTYVTPIRIGRYLEASFVRCNLERGAAQRAAAASDHRKIAERLERIRDEQQEALSAADYLTFFRLDQRLHRSIFEMTGIPGVWHTIIQTQADVDRVRHLKRIHNIRRGPKVVAEHGEIIEAIRRGEPEAAADALVRHLGTPDQKLDDFSQHPVLQNFIDTINTRLPARAAPSQVTAAEEEMQ